MSEKKRLRIRDIFIKYPLLDKARIYSFVWIFEHGITWFDRSYRVASFIPEKAKPYVRSVNSVCDSVEGLTGQEPCIFAFFHGRMFTLLGLVPRQRMTGLASNSRDGEMIARAARAIGYQVARGSKTHGGVRGALELMETSRQRNSILFNVDGPRGPKEEVKDSIIRIAELTGLPIVPVVGDARRRWRMPSWDKYMCPYRNTRVVYLFGEPINVRQGSDRDEREALRARLEANMLALLEKAESYWQVAGPI